ncbi:hypothetical protein CRG98_003633 [Punica granatum]|uniref:Uncharacterized protein n=1 Tax=Punica granatum TaxID=22663 RepID=A0A2I0L5J3_PUNGR|nr:hypothetical protein CRG98_003633 [Punica granatum]
MGINRFSCRPLVRSDPTLGSLSSRCLNLFIGHSKHTVYPVPLDPGNSTALDLRVVNNAVFQSSKPCSQRIEVTAISDSPKQLRKHSEKSSFQLLGRLRLHIDNTGLRVDPTTLGTNDHHGHLEGSLGYPRPPTLPQKSIGSLRGDVRPDLCQSGLSTLPVGSVATIQVCSSQNSRNPTHQRSNLTLEGPIPPLGTRVLAQPWTIQGIGRHRLQAEVACTTMFPLF